MIDPGAGAGGAMIAACMFVILPVAVLLHAASRRYIEICFELAFAHFLLWFLLWIWLDVLDPESGARKWTMIWFLVWDFIGPLITAMIAGVPSLIYRGLRTRQNDVADLQQKSGEP